MSGPATTLHVMRVVDHPLERLYADQDFDWVVDTVPAVLAWVPAGARKRRRRPLRFTLHHQPASAPVSERLLLRLDWDLAQLEARDRALTERTARMRAGRTAQREHVTELAAYGLALVGISLLLPGRRVVSMRKGLPPDLLFDVTPGALRGVEVAGRSRGGLAALNALRLGSAAADDLGKQGVLRERRDIVEAHLSLWCASPRVFVIAKVKP
ncbi:hypothetical protein LZ198_33175 [Myxococcus sp. K15C18031901]|uniref:hypothetical protein n=1 Tax=Myxococcus dinghuensis TaxID=2906761 RepID=UPI0020A7F70D|nr:hypothetical protein [Myxococcus dinghuensis]MCP3103747.1 hypothetical protein [Myxococcus dinghuensis]